jgi:hypothetical protein
MNILGGVRLLKLAKQGRKIKHSDWGAFWRLSERRFLFRTFCYVNDGFVRK